MRKGNLWLALIFVAVLGGMLAKNLLDQPPRLRGHSSFGQFDAVRAKTRLATILGDERPHPADSQADDEVRDRLVATLVSLGLKPMVRDQFACNELFKQRGVSCARVRNVIVALGPETGKALLINAHYDSVPVGPGASDDGMGVATLLEVAAILKDRPLRRPVLLLFNEGEELGLIGARAFLADPLSQHVDSLVNLEARGVRGPVTMFETSQPNAAALKLFASTVKQPVSNSLATDFYRLMPNYTDVNSFSERHWFTINLAPVGNETRYHSAGDDVAALDPATLQHMGDQTLALAQKLAAGTPAEERENMIFMNFPGRELISIPLPVGAVLLASSFVIFFLLSVRSGGLARGMAVALGTLAMSTLFTWVALTAIGLVRGGIFWRAYPLWTYLGAYSFSLFAGAVLIATIGRPAGQHQLRTSYWLVFTLIGCLTGLIAPGAIIFFIFPPLLAAVAALVGAWSRRGAILLFVAAFLLLFMTWGGVLGLLEELLDNGPIWVFAALGSLIILPLLIETKPLIDRSGLATAVVIAGTLTLLAWGTAAIVPAYSRDRQQRFVIEHVADAANGKSWWSVLNDGAPLPRAFPGKWNLGELPFSSRRRWLASAPADPAANPPEIKVLSQVQSGNDRSLQIKLVANGNDTIDLIAPASARIRTAGALGFNRAIDQDEPGKYSFNCFGRSCDGAILMLGIGQSEPVDLLIVGSKAALPPIAAPLIAARPKYARPQYNRDESISFMKRRL